MATIAFMFPGQGSQYVGMGEALAQVNDAAAAVFREADEVLGEPLSQLIWSGPADQLDLTRNAQPAILATSIAYLRALRDAWRDAGIDLQPRFSAGHSMGQYSALVASGSLGFADALRLVRERGLRMQEAGQDGVMAAVIGLEDGHLEELDETARQVGPFAIANRNAPGQVVISGSAAAVERASALARELGARRVIPLPVSVAAHSPLMEPAARRMRAALAEIPFADPEPPLLANADTRLLTTGELCRDELVEHLTLGVDWVSAVQTMSNAGVGRFLEVGPGKVLSGLVRRIAPAAEAHPLDDAAADGRLSVPFWGAAGDPELAGEIAVDFDPPDPDRPTDPDDPRTPKPA